MRPFLLFALLILAAARPVEAQQRAPRVCFGVSFDRGCRVMFQYEVGVRFAAFGGLPVGRDQAQFTSPSRTDWFVGGGLMFPSGAGRAIGVVYQAGSEGPVHSLGVRFARSLGRRSRLDLTAGGTFLQRSASSGGQLPSIRSTGGVFGEAALHANDFLTALVREESFAPRTDLPARSRLMLGARLERTPAVVVSAAAAVFVAIVIGSFYGEGT